MLKGAYRGQILRCRALLYTLWEKGVCQKYSRVAGVGETLVPPILEFSHSCRVDFNSSPELSVKLNLLALFINSTTIDLALCRLLRT